MPIFFTNDGGLFDQRGFGRACQSTRVKFVIAISYALASSVSGLPSTVRLAAQAAEITFLCVNSSSGTTWNLKVDDERQTADSFPAEFATIRIAWHDSGRGGFYDLDRNSGLLTFRNASSTGGYILYHRCHAN
jgi:hypothetical protein